MIKKTIEFHLLKKDEYDLFKNDISIVSKEVYKIIINFLEGDNNENK